MKVTHDEALKVLKQIPEALLWRIWILYRGNLPADRYYTSGGLYAAPDQMIYRAKMQDEDETTGDIADSAMAKLTEQYGPREARDAESISRQMFRAAQSAGTLVPAAGDMNG